MVSERLSLRQLCTGPEPCRQALSGCPQRAVLHHAELLQHYEFVAGAGTAQCAAFSGCAVAVVVLPDSGANAAPLSLKNAARVATLTPKCVFSTSGTEAGAVLAALAAAGTHSGACAWRWLRVQGVAVKHVSGLEAVDRDAERLSLLLMSLPALESISVSKLHREWSCTSPADAQVYLAGAARAIGRCPCLLHLKVTILLDNGEDQVPDTFGQDLAGARTLEELHLAVLCMGAVNFDMPPSAHIAYLVAGLAGLSRLRALTLQSQLIRMAAPLPACLSRLAQLTSLRLSGLDGLRCAPGWARLPLLASLKFDSCTFAADGEDALPGMDSLAALTRFDVLGCRSLRVLPASLWQLTQLRALAHMGNRSMSVQSPRSELPVAGLPALGAPCFASLTSLSLAGHNLPVFPAGVLAMSCLKHLDLSHGCFEHLPEGVTVLTALEELRLGRYADFRNGLQCMTGGSLDARGLGSLAGFPCLRRLSFNNCCVLFCPSIQAAAVHPRLERLRLRSSYSARGPSWLAFLNFVGSLLQQGRVDVLNIVNCNILGEPDRVTFCAALQAVGLPKEDLNKPCFDNE